MGVRWRLAVRVLCLVLVLWLSGEAGGAVEEQSVPQVESVKEEHVEIKGGKEEGAAEGEETAVTEGFVQWFSVGFIHAFAASISMIIVSEIGDKTFFIAAILAMKYSRCLVFSGALTALGVMTVLSVVLGFATMIIPRAVTFYMSTALLALFGFKMLYEGWTMRAEEGKEEFEEVSQELRKREEVVNKNGPDVEQGLKTTPPLHRRLKCLGPLFSPIFLQAFSLTFVAEWGDRSQITTIILAARENPLGVSIGGTLGHALCTALAVIGGKMVAQRISVRTVTLVGGLVFLLFAVTALVYPDLSPEVTSAVT